MDLQLNFDIVIPVKMFNTALFLLLTIRVTFIGTLVVERDSNSFHVFVNGLEVFKHSNSDPMFYISKTSVSFIEHHGNFRINETIDDGPVLMNTFSLHEDAFENDKIIWTAELTNGEDNSSGVIVLQFWEGDTINDVELGVRFEVSLTTQDYNRIGIRIPSENSENFYGLGEQFTDFNLKGHKYTIWTREQGVGRNLSHPLTQIMEIINPGTGGDFDYTYWPQPTFVSSRRYFFSLDSVAYSIFNFESTSFVDISIQAGRFFGYFVVDQMSLLSLVKQISKIYGRQPVLPEWVSNGAILGVQGGTDKMLQFIDEAEEHGVAVSAMWIQDWSGKITTTFGTRVFWNWEWNRDWYPRLNEVIAELREMKNIRVLSYINPSLNIEGNVFKEGEQFGYFLRQEDDLQRTYVQDFGEFYCGTVDVWNSEAVNWYKNIIKENLLDLGFSGWMADFGEYTPITASTSNSSVYLTGEERHNLLPLLWAKINREAIEEAGLLNEIMFWTRSGAAGASGYSTMLWGAFSAAFSGMGLFHFDIGGFTTIEALNLIDLTRSKELLLRSAEFAVFTPVMRTHEGNQPAANRQIYSDEDTWRQFARLTQIFQMLSNYSRSTIRQNSEEGIPVMRPLFLHYETDADSFRNNYQYMYGDDLLVAPVLRIRQEQQTVYLPPDEWVYLWDDSKTIRAGPINVTVASPLGYTPVFYRISSKWAELFDEIRIKHSNKRYVVNTDKSGEINVVVQGDLTQQEKRAVFMTVHDLGCNHNSFQEFVNSPCMTEIKERSCFIHIDVSGHADNAGALPDSFQFPSLKTLGEDLVTVLDFLHVKYVIGLGEGAGANVLARFGIAHPSRSLGLILINVTGSAASVVETFKTKFINWKGDEVASSAENFLVFHKFGHQISSEVNPDKEKIMADYQSRLRTNLNSKNVGLYFKAFMNRTDLSLKDCKIDTLLITGMLSPYAPMVEKLHRDVNKEKINMLKIERAGDVLTDAPSKVAQSILLFCKGQGLLTSVAMPGVDRNRAYSTSSGGSVELANRLSRGMSMEEYDKPNIRRLSITMALHTIFVIIFIQEIQSQGNCCRFNLKCYYCNQKRRNKQIYKSRNYNTLGHYASRNFLLNLKKKLNSSKLRIKSLPTVIKIFFALISLTTSPFWTFTVLLFTRLAKPFRRAMYASRFSFNLNQSNELLVTSKPYDLASRKLSAIDAKM
ncbi:Sulfoquinovosidase [Pseudolycoriella hygida]|uniref:Sulfoquinovosidase n=1 Tax=Pseudolycoriella hygida TaxID=35572 RepID=A0A9Q0RXU7_9DIPT|nr:Sulfoquinovosidase [Pseudolycoriella hygida]